jgi:hypothetical protein
MTLEKPPHRRDRGELVFPRGRKVETALSWLATRRGFLVW